MFIGLKLASAGEIGHHRVQNEHAGRRAAQAGIAKPLDETVLEEEFLLLRVEIAAGKIAPAGKVDAFAQAKSHQQQFVGLFVDTQHLLIDHAMAFPLDGFEPGFRVALGGGCELGGAPRQASMRAGADAGIIAITPVGEVVAAFGAGTGMVGNLIGRHAVTLGDFLRRLIKHG